MTTTKKRGNPIKIDGLPLFLYYPSLKNTITLSNKKSNDNDLLSRKEELR